MQKTFSFTKKDFDDNGFHISQDIIFIEFVDKCQYDFYNEYKPFYANYLFANDSTLLLMKKSVIISSDYDFGMDLIDGEINEEVNFKIEEYSKRNTIYGIGSVVDDDEPVLLVKDDSMADDVFILKYILDDEDEESENLNPINNNHRTNPVTINIP